MEVWKFTSWAAEEALSWLQCGFKTVKNPWTCDPLVFEIVLEGVGSVVGKGGEERAGVSACSLWAPACRALTLQGWSSSGQGWELQPWEASLQGTGRFQFSSVFIEPKLLPHQERLLSEMRIWEYGNKGDVDCLGYQKLLLLLHFGHLNN